MKRSRIFLGVTTALLAIAGVAAANAHRGSVKTAYYTVKNAAGVWFAHSLATKCSNFATGSACQYKYVTTGGSRLVSVYTKVVSTTAGIHIASNSAIAKYDQQ